jgi:hypothetical protein
MHPQTGQTGAQARVSLAYLQLCPIIILLHTAMIVA